MGHITTRTASAPGSFLPLLLAYWERIPFPSLPTASPRSLNLVFIREGSEGERETSGGGGFGANGFCI